MKHIQNITTLLLAITLALLLSACNTKTSQDTNATSATPSSTQSTKADDTATENVSNTPNTTDTNTTNESSTTTDGNTSNEGSGTDANATNGGSDNTPAGGNTTGGGDGNTATTPTVTLKSLKLRVAKTSLNKDTNTTVKVIATYSDKTTKEVTDKVDWIIGSKDAVKIDKSTLTALKDTNVTIQAKIADTLSNKVNLTIYWEVNGHRLPPEPDPKVNNATLLGVDVNHNGVRDDVERKVYATYKKAIERAVMMQAFRTEQAMLADPDLVKNAREWEKKIWKAVNCNDYLSTYRNVKPMSREDVKNTTEWQINTEQRVKKYYQYDQALSGGVYSISDGTLQDCEFDVEKVLEMDR